MGWVFWNNTQKTSNTSSTNSSNSQANSTNENSYKSYTNDYYKLSFNYPSNWIIRSNSNEKDILSLSILNNNYDNIANLSFSTLGGGGCTEGDGTTKLNTEVVDLFDLEIKTEKPNEKIKFALLLNEMEGRTGYRLQYLATSSFSKIGDIQPLSCSVPSWKFMISTSDGKTASGRIDGPYDKYLENKDQAKAYMLTDQYKEIKKLFLSLKVG